jgi:hypothetical protein
MRIIIIALAVVFVSACTENKPVKLYYGEKFEVVEPMSADELIKLLDAETQAADLIVEGEIEKSCTHSGCWMTLVNTRGEKVFVTYKDGSFTTAKDIKGRKVALKGAAEKDEKEGEYKLVASGLIIN